MPIFYTMVPQTKRKRRVHFDQILEIQPIQDCHCDYPPHFSYYSREELLALHQEEIAILQQPAPRISDELRTWRGLECVRDGIDKQETVQREHTGLVLKFHKRKRRSSGGCNAQLLRQVSEGSSRDAKKLAARRAKEDAQEQGYDDNDARGEQLVPRSKAQGSTVTRTTTARPSLGKIESYRARRTSALTA